MLIRFDPFRDLDRLTDQLWRGTRAHPMPMDAYRRGDEVVLHLDLPGVPASAIDVTVEDDVLTISAERTWRADDDAEVLASERAQGRVRRSLSFGDGLDLQRVAASHEDGVLTLRIPVAEQAKPRKVEITAGSSTPAIEAAEAAEATPAAA